MAGAMPVGCRGPKRRPRTPPAAELKAWPTRRRPAHGLISHGLSGGRPGSQLMDRTEQAIWIYIGFTASSVTIPGQWVDQDKRRVRTDP